MANLEHVQALMADLGPATSELEAVAQEGDARWAAAFDDDTVVLMELDDGGRRLALSADLGAPAEGARLAAYEAALTYNGLWRDHGGYRLALGGEGALTLVVDIDAPELTLPDLQAALGDVAAKARVWSRFIAAAPAPDASASTEPLLRI